MNRRYEISSDGSMCFIKITEIACGRITVDLFKVNESNPVEALKVVIENLDEDDCDD